MIIIASAALLQWILAVDKVPAVCQELLAGFTDNKVVLLLVVNLLLFVVGMILDSTTATILVIPMIVPALHRAGVDPVHSGGGDHLQPDGRPSHATDGFVFISGERHCQGAYG
ncbi:MAG: TRAP transporter large permease subunit [Limnochordia bacterium]